MWKEHQLVMLPTDKAENALIESISALNLHGLNKLHYSNQYLTQEYLNHINCKSYHLYILSNDEIKKDDWGYDDIMKKVFKHNSNLPLKPGNEFKKIIATTDNSLKTYNTEYDPRSKTGREWLFLPKLHESFINTFVNQYNKGIVIDKVEVEYELDTYVDNNKTYHYSDGRVKIKLNSDNTINVKEIVEKTFTKEEVIELVMSLTSTPSDISKESATHMVDYWIKENK